MYQLTVQHGPNKHDIVFTEHAPTVHDLAMHLEMITQVPTTHQKLIYKGKQMTIDYTTLQSDLNIKSGSKVMMLGLKVDPQDEQYTMTIKKVKAEAVAIEFAITDFEQQHKGVQDGHLPSELHPEALKGIHKKCVGCVEQLMKLLEKLDSLITSEISENVKRLKKSTIIYIQAQLTRCDAVMEKL